MGGEEGLIVLIGGVDSRAHLHVVGNPGSSVCFDSIGYSAIGSGMPHALITFISKGYYDVLPLNEALLIAYEAKKISEKAPGVGRITYINIISSKKGIIEFKENDVK